MLTSPPTELRGYTLLGTGKTAEDWESLDESVLRVELIEGELWMAPPNAEPHQFAQSRVGTILANHADANDLGMVYYPPVGIRVNNRTVLQPDLVFLSKSNPHISGGWQILVHPPELAVEIVSPSSKTRDWTDKLEHFAVAGVESYWIVEPLERSVTAFRLSGRKYLEVPQTVPNHFSAPPFPGLQIPLARLFR